MSFAAESELWLLRFSRQSGFGWCFELSAEAEAHYVLWNLHQDIEDDLRSRSKVSPSSPGDKMQSPDEAGHAWRGNGIGFRSSPGEVSVYLDVAEPSMDDVDGVANTGAHPVDQSARIATIGPVPGHHPRSSFDDARVARQGYQDWVIRDMATRRERRETEGWTKREEKKAETLEERLEARRAARRVTRHPYYPKARAKKGANDQALLKAAKKGKGNVQGKGFAFNTFSM
jgi:hypothetical protein